MTGCFMRSTIMANRNPTQPSQASKATASIHIGAEVDFSEDGVFSDSGAADPVGDALASEDESITDCDCSVMSWNSTNLAYIG